MSDHTTNEMGCEIDLGNIVKNEGDPRHERVKKCWITRLFKWGRPRWGDANAVDNGHCEQSCDMVGNLLTQLEEDHYHKERNGSLLEVDVSSGRLPKMTIRITMDMGATLDAHQERQIRSVLAYLESSMPTAGDRTGSSGETTGISKDIPFFEDLFGLTKTGGQK